MKQSFILSFCLLFTILSLEVSAQKPNRISIKGIVQDTGKAAVPFSTVMLLNPKDSTLANFTSSNINGEFIFSNVKNTPYLLKISHINNLPYQRYIPDSNSTVNNLGIIQLSPLSRTLVEVVIKAAKAPIYIKGDTIEYDATTFKVSPGSTVEDLLRRLPGIEVDESGNVKSQGKDVRRVYVDGKSFFGDDPKSATKNIDAAAISKVQVFTEKSEQSKLTGVEDGSDEKAMNLQLKDEYKKGTFGKFTLAGGTENRWASRGSYNKFNEKHQLSFIGYANNINETDVNWEDYGEFKGNNAYEGYDNGDFGFSSNTFNSYYYSGGESEFRFDGKGFTKNLGAGTNYNYDTKKFKYNFSYFYNQTDYNYDEISFTNTIIADSNYYREDTTAYGEFYGKHSISSRFKWDIDSNNLIIAKGNFSLFNNVKNENISRLYSNNSLMAISQLMSDDIWETRRYKANATVIYRHKLKKPTNSLAFSASFNTQNNDKKSDYISINEFFGASTFVQQMNLMNNDTANEMAYKINALYTRKLSKVFFSEVFYNLSYRENSKDYQSYDNQTIVDKVDSLSYYSKNYSSYNRLGTSFRYSNNGLNIVLGIAAENIENKFGFFKALNASTLISPVKRSYFNFIPDAGLTWQLPKNFHFRANYQYSINTPSQSNILPTPIISSFLIKQIGNAELKPGITHSLSINLNRWNPSNFSNIGIYTWLSYGEQGIVYDKRIEFVENIGMLTTIKPVNCGGAKNGYLYFWYSYPIIKTKLTINLSGSYNISQNPEFINEIKNTTNGNSYRFSSSLNFTPNQKLIFGLSGSFSETKTNYSINVDQNQINRTYGSNASIKWQFLKKFFFESNFNFTSYYNNKLDFTDKSIPLWNASIRRQLGKKNQFELRLAVFDVFNKNIYFRQYATSNYFIVKSSPTLSRYIMLSFSYNLKGFENKLD